MAEISQEGCVQQYLLFARGIEIPKAAKTKGTSVRASLEQLSRDPTVKATYGLIDKGTVSFALLCEVPSSHEAEHLAAMARIYGLANVEVLPLVMADDLRAGLEEAERSAKARAALTPAQEAEIGLHLEYQRAS